VIVRSGRPKLDHKAIAALVSEFDAGLVVVGLPLSLSGDRGPAAQAAAQEALILEAELDVPVLLHDERLTTVEAERRRHLPVDIVRVRGRERGRPRPDQARSAVGGGGNVGIDALAATILLQSWLDQKRGES
jgi:putative Holliday junction resolvase